MTVSRFIGAITNAISILKTENLDEIEAGEFEGEQGEKLDLILRKQP